MEGEAGSIFEAAASAIKHEQYHNQSQSGAVVSSWLQRWTNVFLPFFLRRAKKKHVLSFPSPLERPKKSPRRRVRPPANPREIPPWDPDSQPTGCLFLLPGGSCFGVGGVSSFPREHQRALAQHSRAPSTQGTARAGMRKREKEAKKKVGTGKEPGLAISRTKRGLGCVGCERCLSMVHLAASGPTHIHVHTFWGSFDTAPGLAEL